MALICEERGGARGGWEPGLGELRRKEFGHNSEAGKSQMHHLPALGQTLGMLPPVMLFSYNSPSISERPDCHGAVTPFAKAVL